MNPDDTFPSDPQLSVSTSQSVPRPSPSQSLAMNNDDSTEYFVDISYTGYHPHLALQSLSSLASHADVSPNIFIDESSRSVHDYEVMDYFDGSKAIGFKFTPKQVRDIFV